MQAHEDDTLRLLAVAIDHITSCGYTAKVLCLSVVLYRIAGNIGKFGKSMVNCQSFLPQIYRIFNIYILLVGHSPKVPPPNNNS